MPTGDKATGLLQQVVGLTDLFKSNPDTLKMKATFVDYNDVNLLRDTIFAESWRKNETFEQVYDR